MRGQTDISISFATENRYKLREVKSILEPLKVEVKWAKTRKVEIQSNDLTEIATFSAKEVSKSIYGQVAVEDAGLFVESLSDFPGPFSAFVLETIGTAGIIRLMSGKPSREAQFRSAVAVAMDGKLMAVFEGAIKGNITRSPRGKGGFGFDPIFVPEGKRKSFAQLSISSKNNISHRGKAFRALAGWLESKK